MHIFQLYTQAPLLNNSPVFSVVAVSSTPSYILGKIDWPVQLRKQGPKKEGVSKLTLPFILWDLSKPQL